MHDHGGGTADSLLWRSDQFAVVGTTLLVLTAVAYLVMANARRQRGHGWPLWRTLAFLAGLVMIAVVLFSGASNHLADMTGHVVQHLVVMMLAAPVLVAGAPLRLLLSRFGPAAHRSVTETSGDPLVRALSSGRGAAVLLTADYYGSMALFMLSPLYRWSTDHPWLMVAAHVYFLLCGILFWAPLLGEDVVGWQPDRRTAVLMTAIGVPANVLAGALMILGVHAAPPDAVSDVASAGAVYAIGGTIVSLAGVLVVVRRGRRSGRRGDADRPTAAGGRAWPAAF